MIELARQYGRYGYRRIAVLLREAGWSVSDGRIERLWKREGLKVPHEQPKKGRLWLNDGSCVRLRPEHRNHVWSYDFVHCRTDEGLTYEDSSGLPNIEEISDVVIEHHTNSQLPRFQNLKDRLRELVRDAILDVSHPDISNQVALLERLKRRAFDRPTNVWFFTTNYDLLLEEACAEVGLKLINGFCGATNRFFAEQEFSVVSGTTARARFTPESGLTVRLVKLHGSVSWYRKGDRVFEAAPSAIVEQDERCMVLPRRSKVIETLSGPYDRLFHVSNSVLGGRCKHLIASGFSFGDSHINDSLVTPSIASGGISLCNFCEEEPESLNDLRARPNVLHVSRDKKVIGGRETEEESDSWMFSKFVELF